MAKGRRWAVVLALPAVILVGCIGQVDVVDRDVELVDGAADPDEARGDDEYWMVSVRGNETSERRSPPICSQYVPTIGIDRANESLAYDPVFDVDRDQVRSLVALRHVDRGSGCVEAWDLVADPGPGPAATMGAYGDLTLAVEEDGTLVVDGHEVPLGQAAQVTYTAAPEDPTLLTVDGRFRAEVLGAWPRANLSSVDG